MSSNLENLTSNSSLTSGQKIRLALLVFFIIPISGLSIDIYVPSLPAMTQYFNVNKEYAQLSITFYMLGLGLMQLFSGPISDSFGRRKPFFFGLLAYFFATIFIPFLHDIHYLLLLRFIQGVMVALTIVPMRSVIADLFVGREYYKMVNYMTIAWSIGPIIAPAIGGYLQQYIGWQANFYFLAGYSLLSLLLMAIYLPETSLYRHRFHLREILVRYKEMLTNKQYLLTIVSNSVLYSLIILFSIAAPFLIQNVMHYSAVDFGHIALLTGLAWFLGGITNRFLIHVSRDKKGIICGWLMFSMAIIALLLNFILPMTIYLVVIPVLLILLIGGIIFPNNFAFGMSLFPKATGSSNALFGGFVFLLTGLSSGLATYLKSNNNLPLAIAYVGFTGLGLLLCYSLYTKK